MAHAEITHILSEREKRVLTLRFGLEDGRSRSLEDTAQELGPIESRLGGLRRATRERIRQIEAKALRKIRQLKITPGCWPDELNAWEADIPSCCVDCFTVIMRMAGIPGVVALGILSKRTPEEIARQWEAMGER